MGIFRAISAFIPLEVICQNLLTDPLDADPLDATQGFLAPRTAVGLAEPEERECF